MSPIVIAYSGSIYEPPTRPLTPTQRRGLYGFQGKDGKRQHETTMPQKYCGKRSPDPAPVPTCPKDPSSLVESPPLSNRRLPKNKTQHMSCCDIKETEIYRGTRGGGGRREDIQRPTSAPFSLHVHTCHPPYVPPFLHSWNFRRRTKV